MSLKSFGASNNLETIRLKLFSVQFGWTTRCISAGVRVTSIAKFSSETLRYDKRKAAKGESTSYGKRSEDPRREPVGKNLAQRGISAHASTLQVQIDVPWIFSRLFWHEDHRTWWNQIPHSTWPWLRVRKPRCGINDSHSVSISWVNSWRPWSLPLPTILASWCQPGGFCSGKWLDKTLINWKLTRFEPDCSIIKQATA